MTNTYKQFIGLLRCGVCGGEMPTGEIQWADMLRLARMHRVEAIMWFAVQGREDVPPEVRSNLEALWNREIVRDARQDYAAQQIRTAFEAEGIPFAPMKGLILKHDYPFPHMRFMSDLDFFIRAGDRQKIHACMEKLGAVLNGTDSGDINYKIPGHANLEFHGRLLYHANADGIVCYPDWARVIPERNCLTEEGYALNLIGHVAYNIAHAGCGVRFVLDLWVYRHRHPVQPDWDAVMQQLKADGLEKIARNLLDLSEYWFGEGEGAPLLDELGTYILEGGLYGFVQREALTNAALSGGRGRAIKAQVFRSREDFQNRYPWLEKYPYLLPAAWVMRAAKSVAGNRKRLKSWLKGLRQNNKKEIQEQKKRLERFGL